MPADIDRVMQRTRQYWYADGIPEIAIGCLLLGVALLFGLEAMAIPGTPGITAYGLPILILVGVFVTGRLVKRFKARLTYPRTGFVSYSRPTGARRISRILIAFASAAMLAYVAMRLRLESSQTMLIQALLAALLIALAGMGLVRFYALAALALGLGIVLSRSAIGEASGNAILFGFVGAGFVLSGGITLLVYLKRSMPPSEDLS